MKRGVALVALALWLLVGSAHAQDRSPSTTAATPPLPLRRRLLPCLRIDVAAFAPRILVAASPMLI